MVLLGAVEAIQLRHLSWTEAKVTAGGAGSGGSRSRRRETLFVFPWPRALTCAVLRRAGPFAAPRGQGLLRETFLTVSGLRETFLTFLGLCEIFLNTWVCGGLFSAFGFDDMTL